MDTMRVDFYKDDLNLVPTPELYRTLEEFTRINESPENFAAEGFLLDFKEQWAEPALKTVATFANTFGGILIIGISDSNGLADRMVGATVAPKQEMKTSIASSIASNISPTPPYEFWDIPIPSASTDH